jgi:hypothetical protein
MLDLALSKIVFAVDTTALDGAITKIDNVAKAVVNLELKQSRAAVNNAKAKAAEAKADLDKAKTTAALQSAETKRLAAEAKAQKDKAKIATDAQNTELKRLKIKEAAAAKQTRAAEREAEAIRKTAAAVDVLSAKQAAYVASIERKRDLISEGWTRGEASILKTAESIGVVGAEYTKLKSLLKDVSGLVSDPFDSAIGSVRAIQGEFDGLVTRSKLVANGIELSNKQLKQYSRIAGEVAVAVKRMDLDPTQGEGLVRYNRLLKQSQDSFLKTAIAARDLRDAEVGLVKQHRETASAKAFLSKEDERMILMTEQLNTGTVRQINMSERAAANTAKYAQSLRLAGVAASEAKTRLAAYSAMQGRIAAQEDKRIASNFARALQPQITDVAVSLYSGQNPLTVLAQQGGQVVDLFKLSGLEADKLGNTMKAAFAGMLPAIVQVGKAVGGLVLDGLMSLGKSLLLLPDRVLHLSSGFEKLRYHFTLSSMAGNKFGTNMVKVIDSISTKMPVIMGIFGGGFVAAIGAMVVAVVKANSEMNTLVRTVELSGAQFGLSAKGLRDLALSFKEVNTTSAIDFLSKLAAGGAKSAENLESLTKAAVDLQKYGGVSIEDTAKAYNELTDKPIEGLLKLAQSTGKVSKELIDQALQYQLVGDKVKLLQLVQEAFSTSTQATADSIAAQIDPLTRLWIALGDGIKWAWERIKDFARSDVIIKPVTYIFELLATKVMQAKLGFDQLRIGLGGFLAMASRVQKGVTPFTGESLGGIAGSVSSVYDSMKADNATAQAEYDAALKRIKGSLGGVDAGSALAAQSTANYAAATSKALPIIEAANKTLSDYSAKQLSRVELANKAEKDLLKVKQDATRSEIELVRKAAEATYDAQNKPKKTRVETLKVLADNEISTLKEQYTSELQLAKAVSSDKLEILKYEYDAGILSREAYNSAVLGMTQKSEAEQLAVVEKFAIKEQEAYANSKKAINDAFNALPQAAQKAQSNIDKYNQQITNLDRSHIALNATIEDTKQKIQSDMYVRAQKAAIDHTKAINELNKEYENYIKSESGLADQRRRDKELSDQLLWATPEQAIQIKAMSDEVNRQTKAQQKLREAVVNTKRAYDLLASVGAGAGSGSIGIDADPSDIAARNRAMELYRVARENLDNAIADNYVDQQNAAVDAALDYEEKERKKLYDGVSDSIVTALFEGGKAGSKKFRNLVVDALKKPVTLVVNALVNTLMGSVFGGAGSALGSLFGGGGAVGGLGGGGGILGNLGTIATLGKGLGSLFGGASALSGGASIGIGGGLGAGIGGGAGLGVAGTATSGGFMAGMAAAMPWIGLGIGLLAAFGAFRKKKTVGAGITGELGGDEALRSYELKRKGGYIFGGPDYSINDLGEAEGSKALQDTYKAMRASTTEMAKSLGLDYKKIEDYRVQIGTQIHPDTGEQRGVDVFGLSEQEAQEKIAEALQTANNEMAQQILGTWETTTEEITRTISERRWDSASGDYVDFTETVTETIERNSYVASEYAREGEEAIDTLTRLATSLGTVNAVFDSLGYTLYASSLAGADMASELIDAFGSIEAFTNSTSAYYNAYYSEQEKQANIIRTVTDQLGKYNISLPKSKEEYRKLVEAQDLSTEEGRKMYAFLIQLAPMFAEIADAAEAAADAGKEAAKNAIQAAYDALEAAVNAQKEILQKQADTQQAIVDNLQSIFDLLGTNVRELYGEVTSTSAMLATQGRSVINTALSSGVLPDIETLTEAITAVKNEVKTNTYTTKFESDKAKLLLAADLLALQDQTEIQLTNEELILKGIKDQIQYLDELLAEAKKQVDAALGNTEALLSVADALANLTAVLALPPTTANTNPTVATPTTPSFGMVGDQPDGSGGGGAGGGGDIRGTYLYGYATQSLSWGTAEETAGSTNALYDYAVANGFSQADIAGVLGFTPEEIAAHFAAYNIPAFAKGGMHSGGFRIVGENGPELEATGSSRIFNAAQTKDIMSGAGNSNTDLQEQINLLRIEAQATAINTSKLVKLVERVIVPSAQGDALQTSAV